MPHQAEILQLGMENAGRIGPDPEKGRMAKRDLPGISGQQVPGGADDNPHQNQYDQVLVVVMVDHQGQNPHQNKDYERLDQQSVFIVRPLNFGEPFQPAGQKNQHQQEDDHAHGILVTHGNIGSPQGFGDPQGQAAQNGPHRTAQPAENGDDKGFEGKRASEIRKKIIDGKQQRTRRPHPGPNPGRRW